MTFTQIARFFFAHPANRGHRVRTAFRLAVFAVFRRFGRRPREFDWVDGLRLRWYPDSVSAGNAWLCGLLEYADMHFVRHMLRPGDTFVDVGANIGVYTLIAARRPGVRVLAFEPGSVARSRLGENLELNSLEGAVATFGVALSDHTGDVAFTTAHDVFNRIVPAGASNPGITTVSSRRLDDVLAERVESVAVLKVDAEGHDLQVLQGAPRLLASVRPVVIVEWTNPGPVRALLEPLGYRTFSYDPSNRSLAPTDWRNETTSNVIAIADVAGTRQRLALPATP